MKSRKQTLATRASRFAETVRFRREHAYTEPNPAYHPGPWADEVSAAFEAGYRAAISDLRRQIARLPAANAPDENHYNLSKAVRNFTRPVR